MSKVTSKLQVTVPKAIADVYGIRPGDDIQWVAAGDTLRVVPAKSVARTDSRARLRWFDAATARQHERQSGRCYDTPGSRGWTRDEVYTRGRAR